MKSLYKNQSRGGFTLIEIIVVIGILIVIISFGIIVDFSSLTFGTFQTEESKIISVLERARSRSMANMFDTTHGVCYLAPNYVIFRGTCIVGASTNELILANTNIAENSGTIFPTLVFDRLTGNTTEDIIIITDGVKTKEITINNEGAINW
ncbi:hypothetical protein A2814_03420 [Candidatus Nomurabacteria bacterium RIFCSPHIGHO2_01_FULL_38_19]|uniref:General secretion pathway GspH domain-containing protein n=1 Tax=Candidatus Nomurabacteria bacterium RIFCSPHIGHO2_01_FULL_38_19 TaxID=1801732 RepID=A0A1F6UU24_9BACT|nr:MAG: hypothetical protein A2814_03420 [Candidatus Nomurabacteria bacterium RIFCSPHIGHO2_01_FULL_38_19]